MPSSTTPIQSAAPPPADSENLAFARHAIDQQREALAQLRQQQQHVQDHYEFLLRQQQQQERNQEQSQDAPKSLDAAHASATRTWSSPQVPAATATSKTIPSYIKQAKP